MITQHLWGLAIRDKDTNFLVARSSTPGEFGAGGEACHPALFITV